MTTSSLQGRASWWRGVYLVARRESQATLDSNVAVATLIVALVASIAPFVHRFFLSGLVDATPFFLAPEDPYPVLLRSSSTPQGHPIPPPPGGRVTSASREHLHRQNIF